MIAFVAAATIAGVLTPERSFDCKLDKIATLTLKTESDYKVTGRHRLGIFVPPVLADKFGGSPLFSQMDAFEKIKFADRDKVVDWPGLKAVKLIGENGFFASGNGSPQITNIAVEQRGTSGDTFDIAIFHADGSTGKPDDASGLMGTCVLVRGDKAKAAFEAIQ